RRSGGPPGRRGGDPAADLPTVRRRPGCVRVLHRPARGRHPRARRRGRRRHRCVGGLDLAYGATDMTASPVPVPPLARAAESARRRPVGWWGMVLLIATEATIFASLLASYFFIRAISPEWPLAGI